MKKILILLLAAICIINASCFTSGAFTDKSTISDDYAKKAPGHIRVIFSGDRLNRIKSLINTDENAAKWYDNVKAEADKALAHEKYEYKLTNGDRLLDVSNGVFSIVSNCAFVYLKEGETKYAQRAKEELLNAAKFKDWHPDHFLDTATMMLAFSIGYDWLYSYLTTDEKVTIRDALGNKGLKAGEYAYNYTSSKYGSSFTDWSNRIGWKEGTGNWNTVCNGAMIVGALAIYGDYNNYSWCSGLISTALSNLRLSVRSFRNDGGWEEGPGYCQYALRNLIYSVTTLENTLGTSYGLTDGEGIKNVAYYLIHSMGSVGSFNLGDAGESMLDAPDLFWLASRFDKRDVFEERLYQMENFNMTGGLADILFYEPVETDNTDIPLDFHFSSIGNVTMRSALQNRNALYIGMHGGDNKATHGDLDIGSFVLDALGVRWACDLGIEDYNLPGYWYWTANRADYYRKRAEGHNTIVINPSTAPDQNVSAEAYFKKFEFSESGAYSVLDMTNAYDDASSAKRAVAMFDNRSKVFVQDEVRTKRNSEIYWFMHTKANIEVSENGKSAILSLNGKKLLAELESNSPSAVFTAMDASPLPSSPIGSGQTANTGVQKLAVHYTNTSYVNMRVVFIPYDEERFCPNTENIPQMTGIDEINANIIAQTENHHSGNSDYYNDFTHGKSTMISNVNSEKMWFDNLDNLSSKAVFEGGNDGKYLEIKEGGEGKDPLVQFGVNKFPQCEKKIVEFKLKTNEFTPAVKKVCFRCADSSTVDLIKIEGNLLTSKGSSSFSIDAGIWNDIKIILDKDKITTAVDGRLFDLAYISEKQYNQIVGEGATLRFQIVGSSGITKESTLCIDDIKIYESSGETEKLYLKEDFSGYTANSKIPYNDLSNIWSGDNVNSLKSSALIKENNEKNIYYRIIRNSKGENPLVGISAEGLFNGDTVLSFDCKTMENAVKKRIFIRYPNGETIDLANMFSGVIQTIVSTKSEFSPNEWVNFKYVFADNSIYSFVNTKYIGKKALTEEQFDNISMPGSSIIFSVSSDNTNVLTDLCIDNIKVDNEIKGSGELNIIDSGININNIQKNQFFYNSFDGDIKNANGVEYDGLWFDNLSGKLSSAQTVYDEKNNNSFLRLSRLNKDDDAIIGFATKPVFSDETEMEFNISISSEKLLGKIFLRFGDKNVKIITNIRDGYFKSFVKNSVKAEINDTVKVKYIFKRDGICVYYNNLYFGIIPLTVNEYADLFDGATIRWNIMPSSDDEEQYTDIDELVIYPYTDKTVENKLFLPSNGVVTNAHGFRIKNSGIYEKNAKIICALYDEHKNLISVMADNILIPSGNSDYVLYDGFKAEKRVVMLWDGNSLKQLTEKKYLI